MIPGMNLLESAMACIAAQPDVMYAPTTGRTLNDVGQYVTSYADPRKVNASVQAVSRQTYVELGLDMQRNYYNVFSTENATDLQRGSSGDRFIWNNRILQCESETDWYLQDGWTEILVVDVGPYRGMRNGTMI